MRIFNLKDNNIIVEPEVLMVPEFNDLWERDKTKNKEKAFSEFKYIYFLYDFNSAYYNMSKDKKEEQVKRDILKNPKFVPDKLVNDAIEKFKLLTETPTQRLLESVNNKLDEISDYLNENMFTDDNADTQTKTMERMAKYVAQRDMLLDAVNKEKAKGETRKGKKTTRLFEDRDSVKGL